MRHRGRDTPRILVISTDKLCHLAFMIFQPNEQRYLFFRPQTILNSRFSSSIVSQSGLTSRLDGFVLREQTLERADLVRVDSERHLGLLHLSLKLGEC